METKYVDVATEIGKLITEKQAAYGDAFGKAQEVLKVFYPNGIPVEKLADALTVVRVVDKLFRIATDKNAFNEDPWQDIAGYAILSVVRNKEGVKGVVGKVLPNNGIAHLNGRFA